MCNSHKQKDVSSAREVGFVIKMEPFSECDTNLETAAAIENKDAGMEVDIVPDSRDTAADWRMGHMLFIPQLRTSHNSLDKSTQVKDLLHVLNAGLLLNKSST